MRAAYEHPAPIEKFRKILDVDVRHISDVVPLPFEPTNEVVVPPSARDRISRSHRLHIAQELARAHPERGGWIGAGGVRSVEGNYGCLPAGGGTPRNCVAAAPRIG